MSTFVVNSMIDECCVNLNINLCVMRSCKKKLMINIFINLFVCLEFADAMKLWCYAIKLGHCQTLDNLVIHFSDAMKQTCKCYSPGFTSSAIYESMTIKSIRSPFPTSIPPICPRQSGTSPMMTFRISQWRRVTFWRYTGSQVMTRELSLFNVKSWCCKPSFNSW